MWRQSQRRSDLSRIDCQFIALRRVLANAAGGAVGGAAATAATAASFV